MPLNKKLSLSPLPEQQEDYSHYEEEVIRWDRIIVAGISVLALIALLIFMFSGNSELSEASTEDTKSLAPDTAVNTEEKTLSDPVVVAADVAKTNATEPKLSVAEPSAAEENAVIPQHEASAAKVVEQAVSTERPVSLEQESVSDDVSQNNETTISDLTAAAVIKKEEQEFSEPSPVPDSDKLLPASILITNSAIKAAVLNISTDKGLPGELVKHSIEMPAKGLIKVMLTTEMHGMKGKRLFHDWYRNGERQARVRIPVNVETQTSYSSKFIDKYMLGSWQVKVIDTSGEPYILADFDVISSK